jgi:hypothetical protein
LQSANLGRTFRSAAALGAFREGVVTNVLGRESPMSNRERAMKAHVPFGKALTPADHTS